MYVCMVYRLWYVKFKGSLLVEAVQSWPLIGRHVAGELASSSDVTVLEHSILKLTAWLSWIWEAAVHAIGYRIFRFAGLTKNSV